jgi:universal stress protein A
MRALRADRTRILVPLERGESAREPARLLGGLFAPAATRVRAIHVTRVLVPHFYLPPGLETLDSLRLQQLAREDEERRALERQVEPLEEAGFEVETEVTSGSPLAEIRKRAELWRADLILARPGRGRARAGGLGGVATGLMQVATAPVLFYRRVPSGYRVGSILAPVDFSPFSRKAIAWAVLLASLAQARVRLLHVLPEKSRRWSAPLRRAAAEMVGDERRRAERLLREFGSPGLSIEAVIVEREDPAQSVLEAQKDGIGLVVLGASGKTGVSAVLGSVTRRVVRDCPCPVVVLPTANRASAVQVWRKSRHGKGRGSETPTLSGSGLVRGRSPRRPRVDRARRRS